MSKLSTYLSDGFSKVEGWVLPDAVSALQEVSQICDSGNIGGGACEIGVHHGRFFIALLSCVSPDAPSLAIDLFEAQEFNIDRSGKGSRDRFEANVSMYAPHSSNLGIISGDSLGLSARDISNIGEGYGQFRFFSVDGGHTVVHAFNDILIAQELTRPGGFIIVDDFFQPDWPGVTEAVFKFCLSANTRFLPLCVAGRKLFMAHQSYAQRQLLTLESALKDKRPQSVLKKVRIAGADAISFHLHPSDPVLR